MVLECLTTSTLLPGQPLTEEVDLTVSEPENEPLAGSEGQMYSMLIVADGNKAA